MSYVYPYYLLSLYCKHFIIKTYAQGLILNSIFRFKMNLYFLKFVFNKDFTVNSLSGFRKMEFAFYDSF
jgi:hypothetical protein